MNAPKSSELKTQFAISEAYGNSVTDENITPRLAKTVIRPLIRDVFQDCCFVPDLKDASETTLDTPHDTVITKKEE